MHFTDIFVKRPVLAIVVSLVIFLTAIPISYYAARYGVDIDLLTRGAGFGYIGSTLTSLISWTKPMPMATIMQSFTTL